MKKMFLFFLAILLFVGAALAETQYSDGEKDAIPADRLKEERNRVWQEYADAMKQDPVLLEETKNQAMTFEEATMRYSLEVVGEKPEDGYPVYIALHGGGASDTPDINDQQWEQMQYYYRMALQCGVYVAVRGVRDTWDTHFNPESYPLYDRLIQYLILTQEVNPNRIYLEGFSAGGDGVYAIAPRMADRFAAANMSSGHPNGVHFLNMRNLPIQLQAGEHDTAYSRNTVTVEYDTLLNEYQEKYGGFIHRTLIHFNAGHNYADYRTNKLLSMSNPQGWLAEGDRSYFSADSFPPDYMDQFIRDPLPEKMIWQLDTRASRRSVESFYYLRAPYETTEGIVRIGYCPGENRIEIQTENLNGDFSILLNEDMIDFEQPVLFELNGATVSLRVEPSMAVLKGTTWERGDPNYQFEAEVSYGDLLEKLKEKSE